MRGGEYDWKTYTYAEEREVERQGRGEQKGYDGKFYTHDEEREEEARGGYERKTYTHAEERRERRCEGGSETAR